ncbi:MAG: insulinase family protein [Bryobacterales bacterium]|nr:insulinase family protein [Bryobacterales bacterium]
METDLPYGFVSMAFRFPGFDSPEYAAAQVLADVLSNQRSDLYGLVPQGIALSTDFSINGLPKASLAYALAAYPKGADQDKVCSKVREVISGYVKNGFPADLVEAAKKHAATAAELEKNSVSGLAMSWSQAVAVEGRNSPEDSVRAIQRVSVADVNRVARQYLDVDRATTAILIPTASGRPSLGVSAGPGRESFTPKEIKRVPLPEWAANTLNRIAVPASTLSPTVTTLPNGIHLIVQPANVSHTISVYGHIENNEDLQSPPGKEGVGDLLDELFSYGSTTLDRLAFQKAVDEIGAQLTAGTAFSVQVLTPEFDRGVQLLADNQLHPALPETAFTTAQQQLSGAVAGRLESPDYLAKRGLNQLLFPPDDPTLREATPKTVSALTLSDVRQYYEHAFRPDLTTIIVIGEVTPARAREAIEKYFGDWKAEGPKPQTVLPAVPLNKPSFTEVPDKSRVQDRVTLAQTLGLNRKDPDYYALELGNHVLGGGFYATRLFRDLRENTGLVYTVLSTFEMTKTRGIYAVRYACDPQNVFEARGIVEGNLKQMQTSPVSPEELRQAQAMLLREIPLSESSVTRIAHGFIDRTTEDLPLDEPTVAAKRYLRLTAPEVQAAFAKWIRTGDLVQLTVGPRPKG